MKLLAPFLLGAVVMGCLAIGLFFVKFWKRTHDELFLLFAIAFWLFAGNWAMITIIENEGNPAVWLCRLSGFALIIVGIVRKNLRHQPFGLGQ